jgi:hypothetical protein
VRCEREMMNEVMVIAKQEERRSAALPREGIKVH